MSLIKGVGYLMPAGEYTYDVYLIDPGVIILSNVENNVGIKMDKKLGPNWKKGLGKMHSTDHASALFKLWERGQRGISTNGVLQNDGRGYDGNPTVNEITESHRGVLSRTLETAHNALQGEYGYGVLPFDGVNTPRLGWSVSTWRYALDKGIHKDRDLVWKTAAYKQLELIEAGIVPGWVKDQSGDWGPSRKKTSVYIENAIKPQENDVMAYTKEVEAILNDIDNLRAKVLALTK